MIKFKRGCANSSLAFCTLDNKSGWLEIDKIYDRELNEEYYRLRFDGYLIATDLERKELLKIAKMCAKQGKRNILDLAV